MKTLLAAGGAVVAWTTGTLGLILYYGAGTLLVLGGLVLLLICWPRSALTQR